MHRGLAPWAHLHQDRRDDESHRPQLGERQRPQDVRVDAHEFDREPNDAGSAEIPGKHDAIGQALTPPAQQENAQSSEAYGFVQLSGVNRGRGGWQALRKRDRPRQSARPPVIVAHQEATDAADGMTEGEKLHEELISPDDSRRTVRVGDRYVVMPTIATWGYQPPREAESVAENFSYASDTNDLWLTVPEIQDMIDRLS